MTKIPKPKYVVGAVVFVRFEDSPTVHICQIESIHFHPNNAVDKIFYMFLGMNRGMNEANLITVNEDCEYEN